MKVLFVSSGNSSEGISPIIVSQAESLTKEGVDVETYTIKGKGAKGYINNIIPLRKHLKANKYDTIHAHYSLSAMIASLAGAKPLVVSLMGSDIKASKRFKLLILFFYKFFWKTTIVKSEDMRLSLGFKNIKVIPNGVNLSVFYPQDKIKCQTKLNWNLNKTHILFPSNPARPEKNFKLLKDGINQIENIEIQIHTLIDLPHKKIPFYFNAADIVVMTSLWEGSPNAIKEALACNRVIVSTKVGDIEYLLGDVDGTFICKSQEKSELVKSLIDAIEYFKIIKVSKGRDSIIRKGIDSVSIAKRIINLYTSIKNN